MPATSHLKHGNCNSSASLAWNSSSVQILERKVLPKESARVPATPEIRIFKCPIIVLNNLILPQKYCEKCSDSAHKIFMALLCNGEGNIYSQPSSLVVLGLYLVRSGVYKSDVAELR